MDNRSTQWALFMAQLKQKTAFKRDPYYLDSEAMLTCGEPDVCPAGRSQSGIIHLTIPYHSLASFDSPELEVQYAIRLYVSVSDQPHHFDDIYIVIK